MFPANDLEKYFDQLNEKNYALIPVNQVLVSKLQISAQDKYFKNKFKSAGISQNALPQTSIRNDSTFWLDLKTENLTEAENLTLFSLDQLSEYLKNYFRISLTAIECHYAYYEPGNFYKRHRDSTQLNNQRIFSFVIYLNSSWNEHDGGELLGYENDSESILFKIKPEMGQMIIFKSHIEHEVLTTHRSRMSLTGWVRK